MVQITVSSYCSDFPVCRDQVSKTEEFESIPTWRELAAKWNLSIAGTLSNASMTLKMTIDEPLPKNVELYFYCRGYLSVYAVFVQ